MAFTITYPTDNYRDSLIKLDITKPAGDYTYYTLQRSVTAQGNTTAFEQIDSINNLQWSELISVYWDSVNYRITWIGQSSPNVTKETGYITAKTPSTIELQLVSYPESLTVGAPITLQWADIGYYPYEITHSINGGAFSSPQQIARDTPLSYTDTVVTNMPGFETIQYRIKRLSAFSTTITTPVISLASALAVPTISVTPTTVSESGTVTISWNSTSGGTYDLQRSTNDGSTWTTVLTKTSSTSRAESVSQTTSYRARAYKNDLYSDYSSSATVTVTIVPPTAPTVSNPPSVIAGYTLSFSWTDSNSGATYEVARSVDDGAYTVLASSQTSKSYADFADPAWTKIRYRIIASKNGLSTSAVYTSFINVIPIPAIPSLSYPSDVAVGESISLSWTDSNSGATYTIKRSINGASYTTLTTTSSKYYTDTAQSSWSSVKYAVFASKGGASSTEAVTETITIQGAPTAPTVSSVSTVKGGEEVTLTWTDTNSGATYEVARSVDGGAYSTLTSGHVSKSYTTYTTNSWNTVRYRVRARKDNITTDWGYSPIITIEKVMSSKMSVKVGSEVRNAVDGWVMVNGTLRKIADVWVMVDGSLRKS